MPRPRPLARLVRPSRSSSRSLAAGLAGAGVLAAPAVAVAAQVVVTDVAYVHSAQTTTDSHYRVDPSPATPANWVAPNDYSKGSAHVRLEVKTKPSAANTRFQICFEATPAAGATSNYACTDQSPTYTRTGVIEWDTPFTRFYQYAQVDWTKGTRKLALILKDDKNVKPAPENVGAQTAAMYLPTDVRVTLTLVSAGSTYQPPAATPDGGAGDAAVDGGGEGGASSGGSSGASSSGASGGGSSSGTSGGASSSGASGGGSSSGAAAEPGDDDDATDRGTLAGNEGACAASPGAGGGALAGTGAALVLALAALSRRRTRLSP